MIEKSVFLVYQLPMNVCFLQLCYFITYNGDFLFGTAALDYILTK
jgi:hypothetical protein